MSVRLILICLPLAATGLAGCAPSEDTQDQRHAQPPFGYELADIDNGGEAKGGGARLIVVGGTS